MVKSSDKGIPTAVYDIQVIKQVVGNEICHSLLLLHAFTGCDTTSRIFGIGKQSALQKLIKDDPILHRCTKIFSTLGQDMNVIADSGCALMVSLFHGKPGDNLSTVRYNRLCTKVTSERLPPTSSATKYHSLRSYHQVMQWMGKGEDRDVTIWGWGLQTDKLAPVMTHTAPAPQTLLTMIRCRFSGVCNTHHCTCENMPLDCSHACGQCQNDPLLQHASCSSIK